MAYKVNNKIIRLSLFEASTKFCENFLVRFVFLCYWEIFMLVPGFIIFSFAIDAFLLGYSIAIWLPAEFRFYATNIRSHTSLEK